MSFQESSWHRYVCALTAFFFIFQTITPLGYQAYRYSVPETTQTQTTQSAADSLKIQFGRLLRGISDAIISPADAQTLGISTPEFDLEDPYLVEKAQELGNDAQAIFAFVRDEIAYEVYQGSLRGARGTLWSGAGNSVDQASLLIALLRISNVEASYLQGTLATTEAQSLIASMFDPEPYRVVGFVPDGAEISDPINDPELIAEASGHVWVSSDIGDLDPSFRDASVNQSFTAVSDSFDEVPDNLRHKATLRLKTGFGGNAFISIFSPSGVEEGIVFEHTLNASEVVGRSILLGHQINSDTQNSLIGSNYTHIYTPYLMIGRDDGVVSEGPYIFGPSYQEFISSFLGSLVNRALLKLDLEIVVLTPDGQQEKYTSNLLDLISDGNSDIGDPTLPRLNENNLSAIVLQSSHFNQEAAGSHAALLEDLGEQLEQQQPALLELAAEDPATYTDADWSFIENSNKTFGIYLGTLLQSLNETTVLAFRELRDMNAYGGVSKAYTNRIGVQLIKTQGLASEKIGIRLEQLHPGLQVIPFPGQGQDAESGVRFGYGLATWRAKYALLNEIIDQGSSSFVIDDAVVQTLGGNDDELFLLEQSSTPPEQIDSMSIPLAMKQRLSQSLAQGNVIIASHDELYNPVTSSLSWLEINPSNGRVEDYVYQPSVAPRALLYGTELTKSSIIGYVVNLAKQIWRNQKTQYYFGVIAGFATGSIAVAGAVLSAIVVSPELGGLVKQIMKEIDSRIEDAIQEILKKSNRLSVAFRKGFDTGLKIARKIAASIFEIDPEIGDVLIGIQRNDDDLPAPGSGVVATIEAESYFTLPVAQAQLTSLYRLYVRNGSSNEVTYDISLPAPGNGFEIISSLPQVTVPAGETGIVGLAVVPGSGLPSAGTLVPLEITLADPNDPANTLTPPAVDFVVPEVTAIALSLTPELSASLPGESVEAQLVISNIGNVAAAAVPLTTTRSTGLNVAGLPASASIAEGETVSYTLTLSAAADTLNQNLLSSFIASYGLDLDGNPYQAIANGTLRVRSAAVLPIEQYAIDAELAGNDQLAQTLAKIAELTAQLEQDPDNATLQDRLVFSYDQLLQLATVNPGLDALTQQIGELRDLADTGDSSQLLATGQMFFAANAPTLGVGVALDMSLPDRLELEPGESGQLALYLENKGDSEVTLDLSLQPTPGEVSATLNQSSITLQPGEILDQNSVSPVLVDIAQNYLSDELFTLRLEAAPSDIANVTLSTSTLISVRSALADVLEVTVNPAVLDSGSSQASVQAQVLNSANTTRQVKALLQVTQADGTVIDDLAPVSLELTTGSTPIVIDFGIVDIPLLADGVYRMKVSLLTPDDQPLLGRSADSSFLIGSPVSATVEAQPLLLAPGDVETTVQIDVERRFGDSIGLGDFIPTDPSLDRINWAATIQGASISTGAFLLDGLASGTGTYSSSTYANPLILDLGESREFNAIQLHLWDGDDRNFDYLIETSEDGVNYTTLVDKTDGGYRGIQIEQFEAVTARYLRFSGASTTNANLHLIDELLVIGDSTTTPFITSIIEIDGINNAGSNFNNGQMESLAAGVYEVRYLDGAISPWPTDTFNNGRTWQVSIRTDIPLLNKNYQIGFVHDAISRFATSAEAEAAADGKFFTFYLPVRSNVYFWFSDSTTSDNRGSQRIQLRQLSGPNDSLVVRVQDAMTRSVLWEQNAVASWDTWIRTSNYDCFGCHIQSQASTGLAVSKQKIPTLPIDNALTDKFISGYQSWQDERDFVSPFHSGRWSITQTSLWAWAVSHFEGAEQEQMVIPLLRSLNWLLDRQRSDGAWIADHTDSNAAKLYYDGIPSATHTAGNIEALGKALAIIEATLANGEDIVTFGDVSVIDNSADFGRNPGTEVWYKLDTPAAVTGIRLTVSDSFASNSNIVLNELQIFNGDQEVAINTAVASREQSGFPIAESINDIRNDTNDGWAVSGNTLGSPADGLWILASASDIDRLRITQIYPDHQLEQIDIYYTTDVNPTLASNFQPLPILATGMAGLNDKTQLYRDALTDASNALAAAGWNYQRNVRTAAQTLLGLSAALPYLQDPAAIADAEFQIDQVDAYLRSIQNSDGGWGDTSTAISRTFQTAQALEALLQGAETTVDPAILAGAEYLLLTQRAGGDWVSPPLARSLASTTWVQIALPTIFENFTGLTINLEHYLPTDNTQAAYISDSASPDLSDIVGSTLLWDDVLGRSDISKAFTLAMNIPDLQPGEVRQISEGSLLRFISVQNEGEIELDPLFVAGAHIIDLRPNSQTLSSGGSTQYDVILDNPTDGAQTYTLNVLGLEDLGTDIVASIEVPANDSVTTPLTVMYNAGAAGERTFTVQALTSAGGVDSVQGQLSLVDDVIIPGGEPPDPIELISLAVDVQLLPVSVDTGAGNTAAFIVRVTNTGDEIETFALNGVFPAGFNAEWGETQLNLLPGLSNYRDVVLRITPPAGTSPTTYPMTVSASALSDASVADSAAGQLNVLNLGVDVTLTPGSTAPDSTLQLSITNTGLDDDSYQLQLAGAAAAFAELSESSVTLAVGETQTVQVTVDAINLALPGDLQLIGQAISQTDNDVQDSAQAFVQIASRRSVSAVFEPDEVLVEQPGPAYSTLLIQNTGNVQDSYTATLQSVSDLLMVDLLDLNGELSQNVADIYIPPLATAIIPLDGVVLDYGQEVVNADVVSQSDSSANDSAAVLLGTQNRPPLADAGDNQNAATGTVVFLDGSNSSDPDGDLLGFDWSISGLPSGSQLQNADLAGQSGPNPSFIVDVDGDYTLQLTVDDGAAFATDTVVISAYSDSGNIPPNADAGADTRLLPGQDLTLDGTASNDPDAGPEALSYQWSIQLAPAGSSAQLSDASAVQPMLTPDLPGIYSFMLTVDDGAATDSDSVQVDVSLQDIAPIADAGPDQQVIQGDIVNLDGSASYDPDNAPEALSYQWQFISLPLASTLNNADLSDSATAQAQFQPDVQGSYLLQLTVSDGLYEDTDHVLINTSCVAGLSADPVTLWPPNHKMRSVTISVTNACEPVSAAQCMIYDVTSNQPINSIGDGNTDYDWEITGDLTVDLRAERTGTDQEGRIYTMHLWCIEPDGQRSYQQAQVSVPHNR